MSSRRISIVGLAARMHADQDFADFVEVQQPERQVHAVGLDQLGIFAERSGIFAVKIEQQDMGLRILLQDPPEDQGDGT